VNISFLVNVTRNIEVALLNVRVYFHMHVTDCRMFIRISDKMHRSDIISYHVKCNKQKYAIDGLISRSAQTFNIPAEIPVLHTGCLFSRSYYSIF
jgi:hypothetical protein